jgi:mannose-1-phosphate guanylyltransferase
MRVLMLAAGIGKRLRPITENIPKCLVPIGGKPLLQIWLERLSEAGFGPFLINTHYLHEKVNSLIADSPFRDQVTLVYEPNLLGTAGTLIENIDFFQGEDGLVLHADNYCLADLKAFRSAYQNRPKDCKMTMMIFKTDDPESCGIVELDERSVVVGYFEKSKDAHGQLANGAVYVFNKSVFNELRNKKISDISNEIIEMYIGKINAWKSNSYFCDIGVESRYKQTCTWVEQNSEYG